jgi:glucosamine 6-phosphate synthetase-like amidotransferase/phosphosugar isomerase protein
MCGIAGFSLAKGSKINARKLSAALLTEIESRGSQASGFAWQKNKTTGVFKKDIAGSKLRLKGMPRNADNVILHTRLATHGTIRDMANNHPVISPNKQIALVHNGVIYNHKIVRKHVTGELPEVDTSVIPATLEQYGIDGLEMLDGDAAIAWIDQTTLDKLHIARLSHSPLAIAHLTDGSLVFSSTEVLLEKALERVKLEAEFIMSVDEHTKITVVNGIITEWTKAPELNVKYEEPVTKKYGYDSLWGRDYDKYDRHIARQMTSGIECPVTPDMRLGWNLIDGEWRWFDGTTARTEEPDPSENTVIVIDGVRIGSFPEYLKLFVLDKESGLYFDQNGTFLGTEEDLWDDYEMYRYEEYWNNESSWRR